jgi:hypothetical protein
VLNQVLMYQRDDILDLIDDNLENIFSSNKINNSVINAKGVYDKPDINNGIITEKPCF